MRFHLGKELKQEVARIAVGLIVLGLVIFFAETPNRPIFVSLLGVVAVFAVLALASVAVIHDGNQTYLNIREHKPEKLMDKQDVITRLTFLLVNQFQIDAHLISEGSLIRQELGIDGALFEFFIGDVEAEFNVAIAMEDAEQFRTVGDVIRHLERKEVL